MAKFEDKHLLDYRQGGDTIDDFAQKYMANMVAIFRYLNEIRTHTPNGYDYVDPEPNQFRVSDEKLYIRNKDNTAWILLGELKVNFGFKASSDVKFIDNSIFKFEGGKVYAREKTTDPWVLLGDMKHNFGFRDNLSADFLTTDDISKEKVKHINDTDIDKAVTTDMLSKAKIDNVNKLDFSKVLTTDDVDLTKVKDINNLDFSKVITTDAITKEKIKDINTLNFSRVVLSDEVTSAYKMPDKIVRTNNDGMIQGDITGNAAKLAGIRASVDNVEDGQVLTYRAATNTWHNENKSSIGTGKALNIFDNGKLLCTFSGDETQVIDLGRDVGSGGIEKDESGNLVLKDVKYPNDGVRLYQHPDGSITLAPRVFYSKNLMWDKEGNIVLRKED